MPEQQLSTSKSFSELLPPEQPPTSDETPQSKTVQMTEVSLHSYQIIQFSKSDNWCLSASVWTIILKLNLKDLLSMSGGKLWRIIKCFWLASATSKTWDEINGAIYTLKYKDSIS